MKKFTNDQRTRMTRILIRKAFLELLCQKPIQSISVRELCALAGVSRGTFYAHYADIYDLMRQIEDDMTEALHSALEPLKNTGDDSSPVLLNTRIFEVLKENSDLCTVVLGDYGDKQFAIRLINLGYETCRELYRDYLNHASDQEFDYYYAFVSSGMIGLLRQWLSNGMQTPPSEVARLAEGIMLRGIGVFSETGAPAI